MGGIELVIWRDAHSAEDDENWTDDYLVQTVGWAQPDPIAPEKFLRLEWEHTPDGPRDATRIPLVCIISRTPLLGYASALDTNVNITVS